MTNRYRIIKDKWGYYLQNKGELWGWNDVLTKEDMLTYPQIRFDTQEDAERWVLDHGGYFEEVVKR